MLRITIPGEEGFDELKNEFVRTTPEVAVVLEHSLVSMSKWESEFEIAFLGKAKKTDDQIMKYVEYMLVEPIEDPSALQRLSPENVQEIRDYIVKPNTATRLMELPNQSSSRETVTSDLIYYWMIALQIPWEAQHWHINRLMTLIDLTQRKNNPPKNFSKAEAARQRAKINQARRRGKPG